MSDDTDTPSKLGAPSKWKPHFPAVAKAMAKLGATDFEIAQEFGISQATMTRWKSLYPELTEAMAIDKAAADDRVEVRFYQRAIGYSHEEEKHFVVDGKIETVITTKHYPPDTAAAFIWLKNRRPDIWRERREDVKNLSEQTNQELRTTAQRLRDFMDEIDDLTDGQSESNAEPSAEAGDPDPGEADDRPVILQNEPLDPA